MKYKAHIIVSLQEGMTDPEGNATADSLKNLGFPVEYAKKSAFFEIGIEAGNRKEARSKADEMCKRLLANPVKDDYKIIIKEK